MKDSQWIEEFIFGPVQVIKKFEQPNCLRIFCLCGESKSPRLLVVPGGFQCYNFGNIVLFKCLLFKLLKFKTRPDWLNYLLGSREILSYLKSEQ